MIIKSIAQICKSRKTAVLYETESIQWISDGNAVYPLYKMPKFNKETLPTLLDIPEKKVESYVLREDIFPKSLNRLDYDETEVSVSEFSLQLAYLGDTLLPLNTSHGLVFIDTQYLKPLKDLSIIQFFERETTNGVLYIAVKSGLLLVAIILPKDIITKNFLETMNTLYIECNESYLNNERKREKEINNDRQTRI